MNFRTLSTAAVVALAMAGASHAATLVADYTFSDSANLGADTSGEGNNATVVSGVTQGAGPTAGSFSGVFNQGSQFDIYGGLNGYTGLPGFSFVAWVNVDGSYGGYNGVLSQDFGGCCLNRLLLGAGTTPFINVGEHLDVSLTESYATGGWYQIALTAQDLAGGGAIAAVYVDGVQLGDTPQYFDSLPNLTGVNTYLGAGENGQYYHLSGSLADVQIYQGALTSSEVAGLYGAPGGVPEPAAWMLMLVGFGGMGMALRARNRAAAATV